MYPKSSTKIQFTFSNIWFLTIVLLVCSLLLFNQIQAFSQNNQEDQKNPFLENTDFNVVAAGDFSCNEDAKNTVIKYNKNRT